jgi:hypothetical protein
MHGPKSASEPYVSFVTYSRNDDYAGGLRKLHWSTRYLGEQCDEAGLAAESVIVEWNPPVDREPLADALSDLPARRNLTVRVITVPPHVHSRYARSGSRPLHAAVAANVGLRRATGKFVLLKVADAFYPDALIRFLAGRSLQPDRLYRAKRIDVPAEASELLGSPRKDFLAYCAACPAVANEHLPQPYMPFSLPNLFTNACGDFQLLSRERLDSLRGYWESSDVLSFEADSMLSYSAYAAGLREEIIPDGKVYKISHGQSHSHRVQSYDSSFTKLMVNVEGLLRRAGLGEAHVFWMRAVFDYPPKFYGGVRKPVYQRSLLRFKLLSHFPALTRLKGRTWGLGGEELAERMLTAAQGGVKTQA